MINAIRSLVRPIILILLTLAIVVYTYLGTTIPDKLWEAYFIVLVWWFADRRSNK